MSAQLRLVLLPHIVGPRPCIVIVSSEGLTSSRCAHRQGTSSTRQLPGLHMHRSMPMQGSSIPY